MAVGFLFSLGHSTVVLLGSAAIAATALSLPHRMDAVRHIGGLVGTLTSTLFLFGIAIVNLVVLRSVYLAFRRVRRGERRVEEDFDLLLGSRGFITLGLGSLVYELIESANMGWEHPLVLASLIAGCGCLILFLIVEANVASPMIPLALFASSIFSGTSILTLLLYAAIGVAVMSSARVCPGKSLGCFRPFCVTGFRHTVVTVLSSLLLRCRPGGVNL